VGRPGPDPVVRVGQRHRQRHAGRHVRAERLRDPGHFALGARILHGRCYFGDFGTSVTLDIGLFGTDGSGYISADNTTNADDEDWLGAAIDVATAAGAADFANTAALHMGYVTEKEVYLRAKFEGATPSTPPASSMDTSFMSPTKEGTHVHA